MKVKAGSAVDLDAVASRLAAGTMAGRNLEVTMPVALAHTWAQVLASSQQPAAFDVPCAVVPWQGMAEPSATCSCSAGAGIAIIGPMPAIAHDCASRAQSVTRLTRERRSFMAPSLPTLDPGPVPPVGGRLPAVGGGAEVLG